MCYVCAGPPPWLLFCATCPKSTAHNPSATSAPLRNLPYPLSLWQGLLDYTLVPVDPQGLVSPADVAAAITPATCLVSTMHSNNEVGSIQPVAAIARAAHEAAAARGAPRLLVHSDAAQSLGKVDVDVQALGVDLLTIVSTLIAS